MAAARSWLCGTLLWAEPPPTYCPVLPHGLAIQTLLPKLQVVARLKEPRGSKPAGRWRGDTMVLRGCVRKQEGSSLHSTESVSRVKGENRWGWERALNGLKDGLEISTPPCLPHQVSPSQSPGPAPGGAEREVPRLWAGPGSRVAPGTGRRYQHLGWLQLTRSSTAPSDLEINPQPSRHQHPHTRPPFLLSRTH